MAEIDEKKDLSRIANPVTARSFTGTVVEGVHVVGGMGNALSVETDAGVVQLDTGNTRTKAREMLGKLREITEAPVHAIVYSHGHLGYNDGVTAWLEDAEKRGDPPPRLIAHENLVRRWHRYRETEDLQKLFIELQFRAPIGSVNRPLAMTMPIETFRESLTLGQAGREVELLWAPSETDDTIVLWLPEVRLLYGSAAITFSIPNVGTPLRTLRDPIRWADTLDRLASLDPEIVVMEFGPPIRGREEIQRVLQTTAGALRWLRREVVERMNRGMNVIEILHDIEYDPEILDLPWMRPIYGYADYIVRDIFGSESGWWDRNPTHLHPAHPDDAGSAVLSAISDRGTVLERARALADEGQPQLALHVIDVLALAPGEEPEVLEARKLKAELCRTLGAESPSFVSQSLYVSSARIIEHGADKPTGVR